MTETHSYLIVMQGDPTVLNPQRDKLIALAVDTFLAGASILKFECVIGNSNEPTAPSKSERAQKTAAAPQSTTTTKQSKNIAKWVASSVTSLADAYEVNYGGTSRDLKLNSLIVNRLQEADITSVGQLLELSPSDLLSISKFGVGMLARLEEMLALQRLKLQPDED